jgi:predicted dinucleotide-binding enzyme
VLGWSKLSTPHFAGTLTEGKVAGQPLDVLIAGDDEGAKKTVAELVRAGGLNAIDAGPLKRARELEALGFLLDPNARMPTSGGSHEAPRCSEAVAPQSTGGGG